MTTMKTVTEIKLIFISAYDVLFTKFIADFQFSLHYF